MAGRGAAQGSERAGRRRASVAPPCGRISRRLPQRRGAAPYGCSAAILALQGSVEPHAHALGELGVRARPVRRPADLEGVTHLVLPGGESTTLHRLMQLSGLWEPVVTRARRGELALLGTCAGAILLGRDSGEPPARMGLLEVDIKRNAYGRQIDSFIAALDLAPPLGSIEAVFIRAPRILDAGAGVEVLATWRGDPVLVRQGRLLAATFHPELSVSRSIHGAFLEL